MGRGDGYTYNPRTGDRYKPKREWEKKSKRYQKGECYVATAVYGSYDCPEVWTLRRYRDNHLAKSFFGRLFIKMYYSISPAIVRLFGKKRWFNSFFKNKLDKMVDRLRLNGYSSDRYEDNIWY